MNVIELWVFISISRLCLDLETKSGLDYRAEVRTAGTVLHVERVESGVSLMDRLARLFREPTDDDHVVADRPATTENGPATTDDASGSGDDSSDPTGEDTHAVTDDDAEPTAAHESVEGGVDAVAVVVQAPPAGVRRFELTVRATVPVAAVEPALLTRHFETFDEGTGVVCARAVDVDGNGRDVEAAPLFVVRFAAPADPDTRPGAPTRRPSRLIPTRAPRRSRRWHSARRRFG